MHKMVIIAILIGVFGVNAPAQVMSPRIIRVEVRDATAPAAPLTRGLQSRRLTKFTRQAQPPGDLVIDVRWMTAVGGERNPLSVLFEYRRQGHDQLQRLTVMYPDGANGEQIARFMWTADEIEREGRPLAWRIRLLQGARVLDERRSEGWR